MANRTVNAVVRNRDGLPNLRHPRRGGVNFLVAGVNGWQTARLTVWGRLVQRYCRNPLLRLEPLVVSDRLRDVQLPVGNLPGRHHLCLWFGLLIEWPHAVRSGTG